MLLLVHDRPEEQPPQWMVLPQLEVNVPQMVATRLWHLSAGSSTHSEVLGSTQQVWLGQSAGGQVCAAAGRGSTSAAAMARATAIALANDSSERRQHPPANMAWLLGPDGLRLRRGGREAPADSFSDESAASNVCVTTNRRLARLARRPTGRIGGALDPGDGLRAHGREGGLRRAHRGELRVRFVRRERRGQRASLRSVSPCPVSVAS
jgi:hypothetical protein